jgi:hypothetical protein
MGGLCFILENYEVWTVSRVHYLRRLNVPQRTNANDQAIESLARRVEALTGRLNEPIPDGDGKERDRRNKLEE